MNDLWFDSLRTLIEASTGVSISADKQYLAESRLSPLVSRFELGGFRDLVQHAEAKPDSELGRSVTEAMMTGETFFFRDIPLFNEIRSNLLPQLMDLRQREKALRIWCAACSTGQEAYSIAMILDEFASALSGWQIDFVATDISRQAIDRAKTGVYNQFEVQRGLPVTHLLRHFHRHGDHWRISEYMRSQISFSTGNLLRPAHYEHPFDLILCRNALIYFDHDVRQSVLGLLDTNLQEEGLLIVGSSETNILKAPHMRNSRHFPSVYSKVQPQAVESRLSVLESELAGHSADR
jgi:chemotaxis protein methyltransferase CheR